MTSVASAMDCRLVVPCYNEEDRLDRAAWLEFLDGDRGRSVLFVNDGSTDRTAEVLEGLCRERPAQAGIHNLATNSGKAEAVRQGMLASCDLAGAVGYWDADLATPLAEVAPMLEILATRPSVDLVMGARVQLLGRTIVRNPLRHYAGRAFATCASLTLGLPVYDTQCGAKLLRATAGIRDLFGEAFVSRWIFDVELLARMGLAARRQGLSLTRSIVEYPLNSWLDVKGSKVRGRDFGRAGVELLRIGRTYR